MIERIPKVGIVDAKIAMYDMYEYRYGIFNHAQSKDRPLASVAFHPCEDYTGRTIYYDALVEYAEGGYFELWGLSLQEFLGLPSYLSKMIKEATVEVRKRKTKMIEQIQSDMASKKQKSD